MIIVAGTSPIHADQQEEAIKEGISMAAASQAEDGCIAYRVTADLSEPSVFHIMEVWKDEAALQHHFATPHFLAFARFLSTALDGEGVFRKYQVSSEGPLFG
jgi:quinol monooxygenase YgiN